MQLNIDLTQFDLFPVEFKEVNPEDFMFSLDDSGNRVARTDFKIENGGNKVLISPDNNGYINDTLQEQLELTRRNTVVINAPVGSGKSHAIIQTVKRYFDSSDRYLIFVASPFVSLVKQYCNDIEEAGIPNSQIYSYDNLGRCNIDYTTRAVQVITANTLLGNPGEDGFKNSDIKREYINTLVRHCEEEGIKVVFIYDEIHDSYHNFQQEYIFNLWKWRNVIHKNFILSATYNEVSKVVIEYLAELTDYKIQIIESERKRFVDKQSTLHLHYSSAYNFTSKTKEINDLIKELILREKNIDILCYSKSLAKSLINPKDEIGKLLLNTYREIKDCTSELTVNQREENTEPNNQYDNKKCNIGTNFKTGVSIKKNNHAFVIILPPRSSRLPFSNKYGIFSGGINSVIQALARQRKKGEIHIILSKPDKFVYDTLEGCGMTVDQKNFFKQYYDLVEYHKVPENMVEYVQLNKQDSILREFYENKLKGNVQNEIIAIDSLHRSTTLPRLKFPSYHEFKLESGENYLASVVPIFGGDISAYTTYSALANQFINCRLAEIRFRPVILFEEGSVQNKLVKVFENFFGEDYFYSLAPFSNFSLFYNDFRTSLFRDYQLKFKRTGGTTFENIEEGTPQAKKFEIQLLLFINKLKNINSEFHNSEDYSRSDYFVDSIAHTKEIDIRTLDEGVYKNKIEFYQLLNYFREKIISSLIEYNRGNDSYHFLPTNYYEGFFTNEDKIKVTRLISLLKNDKLLDNGVFEFKRRFEENKTQKGKLKTLYSILREDFLDVEHRSNDPRIDYNGKRRRVKPIRSIKIIPTKARINLVEEQDFINLDYIKEYSNLEDLIL